MASPARKSSAYHHGELRQALTHAAWDMINDNGVEQFTIVDAATRAGVSKAAPYRHFKDRDALLEAVIELGFTKLGESAAAATESFELGSRVRIIAGGNAYMRFFQNHPNVFDLMFKGRDVGTLAEKIREQENLELSCIQMHIANVKAWCLAKQIPQQEGLDIAINLWAWVHGMVSLNLNNNLVKVNLEADPFAMLDTFTHAFLDGIEKHYH